MLINPGTKPSVRKIGVTKYPIILFTLKSLVTMRMIVDACPQEVGWYGIVEERESDGALIIDEIILLKQEVNGGTCELVEDGFAELYQKFTTEGREDDIQKLRFWGHSHASGGVSPSPQDEKQSLETLNDTQDFLVRAICNKEGKMSIAYFDFEKGVCIDNAEWQCDDGLDRVALKAELDPIIKKNVKELTFKNNKANNVNSKQTTHKTTDHRGGNVTPLDNLPGLVKDFNNSRRGGRSTSRFSVLTNK